MKFTRGHIISHISPRAFSLVELLIVLGVLAIALSMALPMLGVSMMQGRMTRWLALSAQHGVSITLYASGHHDLYPIAHPAPDAAGQIWYDPLIAEGHYASLADIDPEDSRNLGFCVYWMSRGMVEDPALMLPGKTLPPDSQHTAPIGQHQVLFPSSKGLVLQATYPRMPLESAFAVDGPHTRSPAAFVDGSGQVGTRLDFNHGEEPDVDINGYGLPIWTTWEGCKGRDR